MKSKLRYVLVSLAIVLIATACTQNRQHVAKQNSTQPASNIDTFDLSKLLLNENIVQLMAAQGVKPEKSSTADQTLLGLNVFKSEAPKVLLFGSEKLSGKTGENTNHVWFHYREENGSLAFYELTIYSKAQTKVLIAQLEKLNGKPVFELIGHKKGTTAIDLEGNPVPWKPGDNYAYHVWENKQTGISYFLGSEGFNNEITTELTALKRTSKFGQDWIKSERLDWYKNE